MKTDVEELLREGMERFTTGVRAPGGLARAAAHLHRRRLAVRAAVACGTAAVTAAAVIVATGAVSGSSARPAASGAQERAAAYVVKRVENALTGQNLVYRGQVMGSDGEPSIVWAYGPRSRWEEFTGRACGHTGPGGECSHRGGSERYLAEGTALVKGKLTNAYVTYFDRKYSLSAISSSPPPSACATARGLGMGGPLIPTDNWSAFISATLACGAASVTGHVWINGVETTRITGKPVTAGLKRNYAKAVHEEWTRVRWTLYVDPTTYLPVRILGSTATFGGSGGSTLYSLVTNVRWLPPTAANIAKATLTIPAGFHRVSSPANQ